MKICKMTSVLLAVILSVSLLVTPAGVMADDSSSEQETQKTEASETKTTETEATEPKATKPKATEPEVTEPKESETKASETEPAETTEKETEATEPETTEPKESETKTSETEPAETTEKETEETELEATEPEAKDKELPKTVGKKKASKAHSGSLGSNITWTFDDSGIMTVSGNGEMPGIENNDEWKQDAAAAKTVVIEDGVTSICKNAFANCSDIYDVTLAGSVATIGEGAFRETGIENLVIPQGVKDIHNYAFFGCKELFRVELAESVKTLGIGAFGSCEKLYNVYLSAQLLRSLTPQFILGGYNPFIDCPSNLAFTLTTKYTNFLNVKGKTAKVKYKKLRKKKQTLSRSKVLSVSDYQGTISFTKLSGKKKISINKKTGKVTIKKKLKKGTYKVKVRVSATGDENYAPASYVVTFRIKVK